MLFRALGIIACLFPIGWGIYSIRAGLNSHEFGPVYGGAFTLLIGLAALILIIATVLEQIVNGPALTDCDKERHYRDLCTPRTYGQGPKERALGPLIHGIWSDQQMQLLKELNTPDPHLIHPDDAKRLQPLTDAELDEAVAEAEQRRLDIKV